MIDAIRLAKLNKQLKEVAEECNNIFDEIYETHAINGDNTFIISAFFGRNDCNNIDFPALTKQIKKYKISNCGTVEDCQKSVNSIAEMLDFFEKVFK